jgi:hypothetical protein
MVQEHLQTDATFRLTLRYQEERTPLLLDISSALYDFNVMYEVLRLAVDPKYDAVSLKNAQYLLRRNGRPLAPEDRLHVEKLVQQSPLELITILAALPGAAATIWAIAQATEKLVLLPLNREKLRQEIEKLRRENQVGTSPRLIISTADADEHLTRRLETRGVLPIFQSLLARLGRARTRLTEISVELVERYRRRGSKEK